MYSIIIITRQKSALRAGKSALPIGPAHADKNQEHAIWWVLMFISFTRKIAVLIRIIIQLVFTPVLSQDTLSCSGKRKSRV